MRTRPPPTYAVSSSLFLRLLGASYGFAFWSLGTQILGLIGQRGIVPAADLLDAAHRQFGSSALWRFPTLCWLSASDPFLKTLCLVGTGLAALLACDVAPALLLAALWALYLSLATVCREFLWFQWDSLLLEAGLLGMLLAPLRLRPSRQPEPPEALVRWLVWWLLFRLMCSSGVVKLASGDPAWRTLTALTYHYETQPLPTWIGWWAHQLPSWFQRLSCAAMFAIELAAPFAIFCPTPLRRAGCWALILLQWLIALTGNYAFFNLLTVALCLLLLDDAAWPSAMRATASEASAMPPPRPRHWPQAVVLPVSVVLLLLSSVPLRLLAGRRPNQRDLIAAFYQRLAPYRLVNTYGLFAVMTTTRNEIVLEGSRDGLEWKAYEFRDKPGDPRRPPAFVAPHQPRLDWQMWFAALGTYQDNPWFLRLCARLLEGSPDVLALLASNPFPEAPPRYLRAALYTYHFTDPATRRASGAWWRREARGLYCPMLSRR